MSDLDDLNRKIDQVDDETAQKFKRKMVDQKVSNKNHFKSDGIVSVEKVDFTTKASSFINNQHTDAPREAQNAHTNEQPHSSVLLGHAIKGEYAYGMLGLLLGLASIIGGIILGLNGVAGSTSWTASVLGLKSQVNDAAPGVVLFIVGVFMVYITKPRVKLKDIKG